VPAVRLGIFLSATAVLAYISRSSLLQPHSHGFYRFFAWECILALLLVNAPSWFRAPAAWYQLISWLLLSSSLVPLIMGVRQLRAEGQQDQEIRPESGLMSFERTTKLITDGIFSRVRHPLYSSLLLLAWGIFFKVPSLPASILVAAATAFLLLTARADERECTQVFGEEYVEYKKRTKMFLPYVL
jgi:protein-S-isoprenylcysteine O-methyltransferase Ste14